MVTEPEMRVTRTISTVPSATLTMMASITFWTKATMTPASPMRAARRMPMTTGLAMSVKRQTTATTLTWITTARTTRLISA